VQNRAFEGFLRTFFFIKEKRARKRNGILPRQNSFSHDGIIFFLFVNVFFLFLKERKGCAKGRNDWPDYTTGACFYYLDYNKEVRLKYTEK